jgi:hypothetical protein
MTLYTPGTTITNEQNEPGALGCFAKKGNDVVLLSAAHVLFAQNDMAATPQLGIYQPNYSCCCGGGAKIGVTQLSWTDGFRPSGAGTFDTDCAIARLPAKVQYSNTIPQIGMITGAGPDPGPGMLLPNFTTKPSDQQLVRMFSPLKERGGLRYGTIFRVKPGGAPSPLSAGPFQDPSDKAEQMLPSANQFLILPRLAPVANETSADYAARYNAFVNAGALLTFSEVGDSGSVVVDNQAGSVNVIGLLIRQYPASDLRAQLRAAGQPIPPVLQAVSNLGIATPISNVLAQMHISIPSRLSGTVPAAGRPIHVFMPPMAFDADLPAVDVGIERLRRRLIETSRGRLIVAKFEQHRTEASRLVNTVRHVTATWARYQGPAFMHHCVRSLRDPTHAVPATINGASFAELLEHMRKMLLRYGSPQLRRDIVRLGRFATELLNSVSKVHDLPSAVKKRRRELV